MDYITYKINYSNGGSMYNAFDNLKACQQYVKDYNDGSKPYGDVMVYIIKTIPVSVNDLMVLK